MTTQPAAAGSEFWRALGKLTPGRVERALRGRVVVMPRGGKRWTHLVLRVVRPSFSSHIGTSVEKEPAARLGRPLILSTLNLTTGKVAPVWICARRAGKYEVHRQGTFAKEIAAGKRRHARILEAQISAAS